MAATLKDISFTDLYIGISCAWLAGVPGTLDPIPAPPEHEAEVRELRLLCEVALEKNGREDFSFSHAGTNFRASVIRSLDEVVFVLRRFAETVPLLPTLGIHPMLVEKLMKPGLSGMIVVSGAFGQGKTTTASSVVVSRLTKFGGVAVTVEDPPEMPLQGRHGEGVCYQTWVEKGGFANACRKATRWAPTMIFLGEIRDAETAAEAMMASINGRLVVCTTHSENAVMAIERICSLASSVSGSTEDVANLLASGLAGVIHQKLENHGGRRQLIVQSLWVDGLDAPGIRSSISKRVFNQLGSVVEQQKNRMLATGHANR